MDQVQLLRNINLSSFDIIQTDIKATAVQINEWLDIS